MTLVPRSGRPASRLGPFGGFVDALARGFGARTAYSVPLSLDRKSVV